jgi:hypothetical protein
MDSGWRRGGRGKREREGGKKRKKRLGPCGPKPKVISVVTKVVAKRDS